MLKINLAKRVIKFIQLLPPKQAKQIAQKLTALRADPLPSDYKKLLNSHYMRVDIGEYRVVYQFNDDMLEIILVGKRNDDEVYKKLERLG